MRGDKRPAGLSCLLQPFTNLVDDTLAGGILDTAVSVDFFQPPLNAPSADGDDDESVQQSFSEK